MSAYIKCCEYFFVPISVYANVIVMITHMLTWSSLCVFRSCLNHEEEVITNLSYFFLKKKQKNITINEILEHKLGPENMILRSDQRTSVNTFNNHFGMFDLPKWICLIAVH